MPKTRTRQIFELRYPAVFAFFDRRSELLGDLFQDRKSKKKNFEHWRLNPDRVDVFDADNKRQYFVSYRNCGFTCIDAPTPGYAKDQLLKYFGSTVDVLGEHIEGIERAGFRETRVVPADDLAPIRNVLIKNFVNSGSDFFKTVDCPIADLHIPIVFQHGSNRFQITVGPATRDELKQNWWGDDPDLPEKALYVDVDYFIVQPIGWQDDLKARVSEFVFKAQSIQNRVSEGFTSLGLP